MQRVLYKACQNTIIKWHHVNAACSGYRNVAKTLIWHPIAMVYEDLLLVYISSLRQVTLWNRVRPTTAVIIGESFPVYIETFYNYYF